MICTWANQKAASPQIYAGSGLALLAASPDTGGMFTHINARLLLAFVFAGFVNLAVSGQQNQNSFPETASKLAASSKGRIKVAFVVTQEAVMIDFAGPWEVFQDVMIPSRGGAMEDQHVFDLYTVSDGTEPIRTSGGLRVTPDFTFDNAPQPNIVVVPAQMGRSPKMLDWLRTMATRSDIVMSVCTGAFRLADARLLNGKRATTHHGAYVELQHDFPEITVVRNMRYVQSDPVVFTSGGLSAGIDLALHIVELYFGRDVAADTARTMEYEGTGWMGDGRAAPQSTARKTYPSDHLTKGVLGNWEGNLATPDGTLQVALHIWPDSSGNLTGTVASVDQDVSQPIASATFKNSSLHFDAGGGSFDGMLSKDESTMDGSWSMHGASMPLRLKRAIKQE